jgi:hypothetical protein
MSIPKHNVFQTAVCPEYPKFIEMENPLEIGGEMSIKKPTCFKNLKVTCSAATQKPDKPDNAATPATPAATPGTPATPATPANSATEPFFGGGSLVNKDFWLLFILFVLVFVFRKQLKNVFNKLF